MRAVLQTLTLTAALFGATALAQGRGHLPPTASGGVPPDKMECAQKCVGKADTCTKDCKNNSRCTAKCAEALGKCVETCGIQPPPPPPEQ